MIRRLSWPCRIIRRVRIPWPLARSTSSTRPNTCLQILFCVWAERESKGLTQQTITEIICELKKNCSQELPQLLDKREANAYDASSIKVHIQIEYRQSYDVFYDEFQRAVEATKAFYLAAESYRIVREQSPQEKHSGMTIKLAKRCLYNFLKPNGYVESQIKVQTNPTRVVCD